MKKISKNKYSAPESISSASLISTDNVVVDSRIQFRSDISWKEANPNESIIGDITDPHTLNNIFKLVGKIIKSAIKDEGVQKYFESNHGLYWLEITNLNSSFIINKVSNYKEDLCLTMKN